MLVLGCIFLLLNILFITFHIISVRLNGYGINESVFYHIKNPIGGVGFSEFKVEISIMIIAIIAIIAIILFLYFANRKLNSKKYNIAIFSIFFFVLFLNPGFTNTLGFIKNHYTGSVSKPSEYLDVDIKNSKSRNLVLIYLESLENTYTNEEVFPGLTPNINYLKEGAVVFENLEMPTGSEWTIAGMVASQCGIPLVTSTGSGNSMGQSQKFLPNANCLGDILNKNGYDNYYYGGADTNFAGKKKFYENHGFSNINGLNELRSRREVSSTSSWGIYDDELFDIIKNDFKILDKNKNYAWINLSLDTHHPFGHVSPSCENIKYKDGAIKILNAVHCTDFLLKNFVDYVRDSDPNAIIAIASDHLAMPNDAKEILSKQDRKNLFFILNSQLPSQKISAPASTYDIAPTLLAVMGFDNSGMGWGRNLLKNNSLLSDFSNVRQFNSYVASFRGFHQSFHGFHKKFNSLKKNNNFFDLNDFEIHAPFAIKINKKKYVEDIFFPGEGGDKAFFRNILNSYDGSDFVYVNTCSKINLEINSDDLCYLISSNKWDKDKGGILAGDFIVDKNLKVNSNEWSEFDKIEKNWERYLYRGAEIIKSDDSLSASSVTYGGGSSWIKTEKNFENLNRGISFYSVDKEGVIKNLDFKDFCNESESPEPSIDLMRFLQEKEYEKNKFIYVIHDTAWCIKGVYDEFVEKLNFNINLEDIDFRESAIFIKNKEKHIFKKSKQKILLISNNL